VYLKSAVESALKPDGSVDLIDAENVADNSRMIKQARLLLTILKTIRQG
jgi:hypothetical protein